MSRTTAARSTQIAARLATFLLLVGVLTTAWVVGIGIVGMVRHDQEVSVHATAPSDHVEALPPQVVVPRDVDVVVRVKHPSGSQSAAAAARDAVQLLVFLAVLWLVREVLRSVNESDPFTMTNVRRLRWIGLLVAVGVPVSQWLGRAFEDSILSALPADAGLGTPFHLSSGALVAGLGLFVLAQVFAHGVELRLDVEGTV